MDGFLSTRAPLLSDVSLVLAWVFAVVAAVGAINGRRRRISRHCPVMATGALLNWIPVLVVMVPTWLGVATETEGMRAGIPTIAPVFHGLLGGVTQLLMTYTVARMYWLEALPPDRTIWLMRATIVLWLLTVLGGTAVYLTLHVL